MSYREDGSPLTGFDSPLEVYQRLFEVTFPRKKYSMPSNNERAYLTSQFESSSTKRILDRDDREKLEEYTTSIRDIERTISREEEWLDVPIRRPK